MARHPKPLVASAFLVLGAILGFLAPPPAAAQGAGDDPETLAEARRIFGEGLAHSDRHEWHEAVAAFRQVVELRSAPPVLYNLAVALVEIREYPEAQDLLGRVLADQTTTPPIRESSEELLRELEAQAGRVELAYRGDSTGVVFFIDDFALAGAALERAHLVSPGAHGVTARRGGTVLARADVDVVRGETARVELASPDAPVEGAVALGSPEPGRRGRIRDGGAPRERPLVKNPWLWTGVGVGVVAAVVLGVTLGRNNAGDPFVGDFVPGRITW